MFKIMQKRRLNPTVTRMDILAPQIASKAEPGQFVILRVDGQGERIPLTIADFDRERGTVAVIFQIVGAETYLLNKKEAGDCIPDFAGPLGIPSHTEGLRRAAIVGGGAGCAIALPVAKKLRDKGAEVHSVIGFRTRELVILEDEFRAVSGILRLMTDDGSYGERGFVTDALKSLIAEHEYDEVIAIGPIVMMKAIANLTRDKGIKTTVSMNPIMIDGTGMCGGCRVNVGGEVKFACVDGLMRRNSMYKAHEQSHYCRLTDREVANHG